MCRICGKCIDAKREPPRQTQPPENHAAVAVAAARVINSSSFPRWSRCATRRDKRRCSESSMPPKSHLLRHGISNTNYCRPLVFTTSRHLKQSAGRVCRAGGCSWLLSSPFCTMPTQKKKSLAKKKRKTARERARVR